LSTLLGRREGGCLGCGSEKETGECLGIGMLTSFFINLGVGLSESALECTTCPPSCASRAPIDQNTARVQRLPGSCVTGSLRGGPGSQLTDRHAILLPTFASMRQSAWLGREQSWKPILYAADKGAGPPRSVRSEFRSLWNRAQVCFAVSTFSRPLVWAFYSLASIAANGAQLAQ
jgi:hypothetical protein